MAIPKLSFYETFHIQDFLKKIHSLNRILYDRQNQFKGSFPIILESNIKEISNDWLNWIKCVCAEIIMSKTNDQSNKNDKKKKKS